MSLEFGGTEHLLANARLKEVRHWPSDHALGFVLSATENNQINPVIPLSSSAIAKTQALRKNNGDNVSPRGVTPHLHSPRRRRTHTRTSQGHPGAPLRRFSGDAVPWIGGIVAAGGAPRRGAGGDGEEGAGAGGDPGHDDGEDRGGGGGPQGGALPAPPQALRAPGVHEQRVRPHAQEGILLTLHSLPFEFCL